MLNLLRDRLRHWLSTEPSAPSYMIYLGRNVPENSSVEFEYVTTTMFRSFLAEQPYFDSFTVWNAQGAWRDEFENTFVVEVFDTDFDIIEMFAQLYIDYFNQEAVYIKISYTQTKLIER